MDNIDGYITKDGVYRIISKLRVLGNISEKDAHAVCEAIKDMPAKHIKGLSEIDKPVEYKAFDSVHMNRIGNKMVALEPHILKQDELLSRIYGVLRHMNEWLSSEAVSECFISDPVCDQRGYYYGVIENLSAEIKDTIL